MTWRSEEGVRKHCSSSARIHEGVLGDMHCRRLRRAHDAARDAPGGNARSRWSIGLHSLLSQAGGVTREDVATGGE